MRSYFTHAALLAISFALVACGPSTEQLTELSTALEAATARAVAADAARAAGVEADLAAATITTTRCAPSVVLMGTGSAPATPVGYLVGRNEGNYREIPRAELATPSTRLAWANDLASTVSRSLAPSASNPIDSEDALAFRRGQVDDIGDPSRPDGYRYVVELVLLEQVGPQVLGVGSFLPGSVRGRIVVWDYAEGRVACHADATATSASEERVGDSAASDLMTNLNTRLRIAALEAIGI